MPVQYEGISAALSAAPSVSLRATGVLPRTTATFTVTVSRGVVWLSERAASCFLLFGCAEPLPFSEVMGSRPGEFLKFLFLSWLYSHLCIPMMQWSSGSSTNLSLRDTFVYNLDLKQSNETGIDSYSVYSHRSQNRQAARRVFFSRLLIPVSI